MGGASEAQRRRSSITATNGASMPPNGTEGSIPSREEETENSSISMARQESQDYEREHNEHTFVRSDTSRSSRTVSAQPPRNTKVVAETNGKGRANTQLPSVTPVLEPPVTKGTLSELDVNKIVHNPKLRHDINFDPDLHFRPNLDGEKGRRKTKKAGEFWQTMRQQLQDYLMHRETFEAELKDPEWCLPSTLKAIRGILETLVPQRDRSAVEETFNVDLLMQQFRKGVADLEKLALWLSQLLKCHCAPMRDTWVDEMVRELSNGNRNGDVAELVAGMRSLLGVLEAMKLDVANHQIRCLRPLLIEDTVQFEQKFFMKKIAMGKVDIAAAHTWFRRAETLPNTPGLDASHAQGNTWDFFKALVNLTLHSKASEVVPHTFLFDEERLIKLRSDMLDAINLEVCMQLYQLEARSRAQQTRLTNLYVSTPVTSQPASPADTGVLSSPTIPCEQDFGTKTERQSTFAQEKSHFKRSYSHQTWVPTVEDDVVMDSQSSSPASSPASNASSPQNSIPVTPLYLTQQVSDSASQIRSSLVAILSSAPSGADRWPSLASSLALQILRSIPGGLNYAPQFEVELMSNLSNPKSPIYKEAEYRVLTQLFPALHKLVMEYTPLTSLQIFEIATIPKVTNGVSTVREELSEIATRLAHIGILHWRVWAPLAYLVDPDGDEENERQDEIISGMN